MNAIGIEQWNWDDGSGQRVMRRTSVGGTVSYTVYAFGLEEHQYNASGTNTGNTSYYSVGGHLIGAQTGTSTKTTTFLLTDLLGSVVASFSNISGSAAVQGNRAYSPYGAPLYQQGSVGTSRGFTGQYADSTSGLDYYNARSYDPLVGQFVSADSVQGNLVGMNPYAYVGGNPETWTDPTGLVATGACGVACTGKSSTSPAGSYDLGAGPCGLSVFGICILPETPPQVSRCDADPESCLPPESIGPEPSPTPVVDTPPPLPPWIVDQWPTLPPLETPPPPDEGSVMGRILAMNEGEAQGDTGNMEEGGAVPQESPQSPNSNELESTQQEPPIRTGNTQNSVIVNRRGDPYPRPVDPRTGELMPFPEGPFNWVPEEARVPWNKFERGKFIAEWIRQGYPDYGKGWKDLDIHHILPREWGGTNDFWNLIPVPRELHQGPAPEGITAWWNDFEP